MDSPKTPFWIKLSLADAFAALLARFYLIITGKSLDSPDKGNVDRMSEKCRKIVRKISKNCREGLRAQFSSIFWTFFAYLVDALVW